jgi:hypothetical protein
MELEEVQSLVHFRYTVSSRLPDPGCLTVPTRPVVVRAAPTFPCASRVRLPSASPACYDRTGVGVLSSPHGYMAPRGALRTFFTFSSLAESGDFRGHLTFPPLAGHMVMRLPAE